MHSMPQRAIAELFGTAALVLVGPGSVIATLTLAGCQSKAAKVKQLQDQYNAEYPAYAKDCMDPVTAGSSALLTGEKLTPEQIAALEAKLSVTP